MKYIKLSFKDAAVCLSKPTGKNGVDCKDFVSDAFTYREVKIKRMKRKDHPLAKDTVLNMADRKLFDKPLIGFEQVSNMLHVLCGCRPVPTYKETWKQRKRLSIIDDITKNVWCKINNVLFYETIDNKTKEVIKKPIYDFIQGKKFVPNANRADMSTVSSSGKVYNGVMFTWDKLKKYMYYEANEKYNLLLDQFAKWYGKNSFKEDYSLVDLLLHLSEDKTLKEEMIDFFNKNNFIKIFNQIINDSYEKSGFNAVNENGSNNYILNKLIINVAPIYKLYINGEFIVPIENETVFNAIINGVRTCTFLEGGYVTIENVTDYIDKDRIEYDGFKEIFK